MTWRFLSLSISSQKQTKKGLPNKHINNFRLHRRLGRRILLVTNHLISSFASHLGENGYGFAPRLGKIWRLKSLDKLQIHLFRSADACINNIQAIPTMQSPPGAYTYILHILLLHSSGMFRSEDNVRITVCFPPDRLGGGVQSLNV